MILHIFKKEVLENLLSLRFGITCILCFLVITASIGILGREYLDDVYDYNRSQQEHRDEIEKKGHPWELIYRGAAIDKPIAAMSIFNKGIDDNGRSAQVFGSREAEYFTKKGKNPVAFLFPAIDLLFFVSIIMSLLAIVFSYDAISGEKFNETLKLMVSYPVSRDAIIIGKWLGGFVCLMLPFILAVAGGLLILFVVIPDISFGAGEIYRLLLMLLLASGFISIIYTFGIMVSANTERPSTSITVLLLIWILLVLVIPNISASVAAFLARTEKVQEVEGRKRKAIQDGWETNNKKQQEYREQNKVGWGDPDFRVWRMKMQKQGYEQVQREIAAINRTFRLQMDRQVRLTKWISRISPLASLKYAAGLLTETGYREDFDFRNASDAYGAELMSFAYDQWIASEEDRARTQTGQQAENKWKFEADKAPVFNYSVLRRSALDNEIADVLIDIGFLLCWNAVFFMVAYVSFIRYDVK